MWSIWPKSAREKGRRGEQIAVDHLKGLGYRIVDRNFTCKLGEIDIIALHEGDLVFVEVRSVGPDNPSDPAYSVNRRKREKITRAAQVFLAERFKETPAARFDVVLVRMGKPPKVDLIRDAFYAEP